MAKSPYYKTAPRHKNPFDEILDRAAATGIRAGLTQQSREWFRQKAKSFAVPTNRELSASDPDRFRSRVVIGRMYMFNYNPKYRDTLPYYDRFPLIFPFAEEGNYFMGLNLHYLPPLFRAKLMDALYNLRNNDKFDNTTKLKLSYGMLRNASELSYFKPCVKKYLKTHVTSRFIAIGSEEWDIALMLPVESFAKSTKFEVWADSKRIITRNKPFGAGRTNRRYNPHKY